MNIRKYLNSNYFIIITYLYTIISWALKSQMMAMIYYLVMAFFIIMFRAKRINLITLIMASIINYRITSFTNNINIILMLMIIGLPIIIIDFFSQKIKFKNEIFIAMLLFLLANLLSLINVTLETFRLALIGIGQVVGVCFLFLYFYNKSEKDIQLYIGKNAMALGIAIASEFIIYLFRYQGDVLGKDIELGWGISNSIAMVLLLIIPQTFYLYSHNQKHPYILFVVMLEILLIILMLSKGAYIAFGLAIFPFFISALFWVANKKKYIIDFIYASAIFFIVLILIFRFDFLALGISEYMKRMGNRGWLNDPTRKEIFQYGIKIYKQYPLFGAGSYSSRYYLQAMEYIHYHNYIIHTLATIGLVGMASFVYYILIIIKNCLKKSPYYLCTFFSILTMLIHGLVDNTWYNPIIIVTITIYLLGVAKGSESS